MFILFYHSMNAEQSFDNLPFSGVNQEKPHNQNFKITILWGGINKKKTVYLHYIIIQKRTHIMVLYFQESLQISNR